MPESEQPTVSIRTTPDRSCANSVLKVGADATDDAAVAGAVTVTVFSGGGPEPTGSPLPNPRLSRYN